MRPRWRAMDAGEAQLRRLLSAEPVLTVADIMLWIGPPAAGPNPEGERDTVLLETGVGHLRLAPASAILGLLSALPVVISEDDGLICDFALATLDREVHALVGGIRRAADAPRLTAAHRYARRVVATRGGVSVGGVWECDAAGWAALMSRAPTRSTRPSPDFDALGLRLAVRVGSVALSAGELRALRRGDALRLDTVARQDADGDWQLHAHVAGWRLGLTLAAGCDDELRLTGLDFLTAMERSMDASDDIDFDDPLGPGLDAEALFSSGTRARAGDPGGTDGADPMDEAAGPIGPDHMLDTLRLPVVVSCAEVVTTLGALYALQPGGVLDLAAPVDGRVALRVGSQVIGRGELVDIDGRLAVVIEDIGPPRPRAERASAGGVRALDQAGESRP